ncbi:MAG: DUF6803 family protein, partial [Gallionella sp.]
LYTGKNSGLVKNLSRVSGIAVGWYFLSIFLYLSYNVVIPLTSSGGWRGIADVIAVSFYLVSVIPLSGIALLGMNLLCSSASQKEKNKIHAILIAVFLVVIHVAMVFGMVSPSMHSTH